jgi:hypothetical protein
LIVGGKAKTSHREATEAGVQDRDCSVVSLTLAEELMICSIPTTNPNEEEKVTVLEP